MRNARSRLRRPRERRAESRHGLDRRRQPVRAISSDEDETPQAGPVPANLFNLTGFTNQKANEIWDAWIVGAPSFGKNVRSVLRVAVAADKNKDGIYNDAPAVVPDSNRDGRINAVDLEAYGLASNIAVVPFEIRD